MANRNERLLSLQSVRWFAALGVVQYHLWFNYQGVLIRHPGTDFFLVLVAVVAAYSQARYIPNGQWARYLQIRYVRLYVTYVPVFLITLLAKRSDFSLEWAVRSFFFLPIPNGRLPVVSVTWMLSMFVLFYWIFSLAFAARREWMLAPVFLIWGILIIMYTWLDWRPQLPGEWTALFFADRNLDFIFGYIIGVVLRNNRLSLRQGRGILWIGVGGLIGAVILLNTAPPSAIMNVLVGITAALVVLGLGTLELNHAPDLVLRFMTLPLLVWLGATSYVLYLTHNMTLRVWAMFLPVMPILVPLITVVAVLVAALGYQYWEKPVLIRLRRRFGLYLRTAIPA